MTVTQKISSTRKGIGIERPPCSKSSHRAWPISTLIFNAWPEAHVELQSAVSDWILS